jgi:hypothetical protein
MGMEDPEIQELAAQAWKWIKPGRPDGENIAEISRVLGILSDRRAEVVAKHSARWDESLKQVFDLEDQVSKLQGQMKGRAAEINDLRHRLEMAEIELRHRKGLKPA